MFSTKAVLAIIAFQDAVAADCRPTETYKTQPGMDTWCDTNCAQGHCPQSHCICDDVAAPPSGGCTVTEAYRNQPGIQEFCNLHCITLKHRGYCPDSHCSCPETTQPEPETTQPEPETTQPEPETTQPEPETTQPEPETTQPEPESSQPEPESSQTEPESTQPGEVLDETVRKAQASVFGDYFTINWNQVICSQDESDAKPYMQQAHPHCATAINMGMAQYHTTDQNGNSGFCVRKSPGVNAPKASSCWKVRCVGGDNALNLGVSCAHHNPIYLKTVDTNMENSLSLTDDQFTSQCAPIAESTNTPSCRAFDITVQAWDLMVVFASNQGSIAGEPAGLNGVVPIEYQEVDCADPVVASAITSSGCGLQNNLLI